MPTPNPRDTDFAVRADLSKQLFDTPPRNTPIASAPLPPSHPIQYQSSPKHHLFIRHFTRGTANLTLATTPLAYQTHPTQGPRPPTHKTTPVTKCRHRASSARPIPGRHSFGTGVGTPKPPRTPSVPCDNSAFRASGRGRGPIRLRYKAWVVSGQTMSSSGIRQKTTNGMLLKTIVFGFRVRWAKATPFANAARRVADEGWRVGKVGLLGLRERLLKMREVLREQPRWTMVARKTLLAGKERFVVWKDAIGPAMQRWKEGLGPALNRCREGLAISMINLRRVLGVALHDSKAFAVVWSVRSRLFLSEASTSFAAGSARHFQHSRLLAAQAATRSVTVVVRLRALKPREILTSAIHNIRVVFLTVSHFSQPLLLKSRALLTQKFQFLASSAETLKTHILSALETVGKQAKQLLPQHRRTRRPKTDSMHVILMGYLTDRTLEQERPATGARPMTAPEIT